MRKTSVAARNPHYLKAVLLSKKFVNPARFYYEKIAQKLLQFLIEILSHLAARNVKTQSRAGRLLVANSRG